MTVDELFDGMLATAANIGANLDRAQLARNIATDLRQRAASTPDPETSAKLTAAADAWNRKAEL